MAKGKDKDKDKKSKKAKETKKTKKLDTKAKKAKKPSKAKAKSASSSHVSPLAPKSFPELPVIPGAEFSTAAAGIKDKGRADVMLARLAPGSSIAGVFTRSATRSAPVRACEARVAMRNARQTTAIIVNSGNANAFTGAEGEDAVDKISNALSNSLNIPATRVYPASTGVIGEPLPHKKITNVVDKLAETLSETGLKDAAHAIMTTDTFAKGASAEVEVNGEVIKIAGIAKGSGMIAPDMATMLAYIFTDAKVAKPILQNMLNRAVKDTFNCISVDGDTSTSDTVLVAATGKSKAPQIRDARTQNARAFYGALRSVMMDLAHQIVKDGEGATKFIEVCVTGAKTATDARKVAMSIANSPLVKTAAAGEDPNWGRIVMAVGKSGAAAERDKLNITLGDVTVTEAGMLAASYKEAEGVKHMKGQNIRIGVDLGLGRGTATAWTCDLTHRYIDINADYRS